MGVCSGSDYIRIIAKILGIIPIVLLLFSASKGYIEASKSKNKDNLKMAQKSFNMKIIIVIIILFIPTIVLITSRLLKKPSLYDCVFGKPNETVEVNDDNSENNIDGFIYVE